MNDVVILQVISTSFWLIIFGASLIAFRKEIRKLLQSLGGFKVAGSSFEFRDRKETIESYVLLAETLIDLFSRREKIENLAKIFDPSQVEKISNFAMKYTKETQREIWNEEMLSNIAFLLFRHGRYSEAIKFYDILLKSRPDHLDLLNLKALAMITSRLSDQIGQALPILKSLCDRYPEAYHVRQNYALALSLSGKHTESIKEMSYLVETLYFKNNPEYLNDPLFQKTKLEMPEEYQRLEKKLHEKKSA